MSDSSSDDESYEGDVEAERVEDFIGFTLSSSDKEWQWEQEPEDEDEEDENEMTLELRQACLGVSARANERNIVEVTTIDANAQELTIPILSMTVGVSEQTQLLLSLKPPVSFRLISGSGPVHITGCVVGEVEYEDEDDEAEEEEEEEEKLAKVVEDARKKIEAKKRSAPSPNGKPAKLQKLSGEAKKQRQQDQEDEVSGEESDDEGSEGDQMETIEEDVEEGEGEEGEEEEEEEESEEEKPKKPAKKKEGKSSKFTQRIVTKSAGTPKSEKVKAKATPVAVKKTPGDKKKTPKQQGTPSIDEIKAKILKTPTIPKKLEKFKNYLKHSFKVKDETVLKQLWEFAQKNQKN